MDFISWCQDRFGSDIFRNTDTPPCFLHKASTGHKKTHGTYISWWLRNRCARVDWYRSFDLFKAFVEIESIHKSRKKSPVFLRTCAKCSELPFNFSTKFLARILFTNYHLVKLVLINLLCRTINNYKGIQLGLEPPSSSRRLDLSTKKIIDTLGSRKKKLFFKWPGH